MPPPENRRHRATKWLIHPLEIPHSVRRWGGTWTKVGSQNVSRQVGLEQAWLLCRDPRRDQKSVVPNCRSTDLTHPYSCIANRKMVLGCVSSCWQATESITLRPLICISARRPRSWIKCSSRSHCELKSYGIHSLNRQAHLPACRHPAPSYPLHRPS